MIIQVEQKKINSLFCEMRIQIKEIMNLKTDGATSTLLEIDEMLILLDCGLNPDLGLDNYDKHKAELQNLSYILISRSEIEYCGALPLLIQRYSIKNYQVFATRPVKDLILFTICDYYFGKLDEIFSDKNTSEWFFAQLNNITVMRYYQKQDIESKKLNNANVLAQIVCFMNGTSIGSCGWSISSGGKNIYYLNSFKQISQLLTDGFNINNLLKKKVDYVIMSGSDDPGHGAVKKQQEIIKDLVSAAEKFLGLKVYANSLHTAVETLLRINEELGQFPKPNIIIYFIHPSDRIIEFFKIFMEFTSKKLQEDLYMDGKNEKNPFDMKYVTFKIINSFRNFEDPPNGSIPIIITGSINYCLLTPLNEKLKKFKTWYLHDSVSQNWKFFPDKTISTHNGIISSGFEKVSTLRLFPIKSNTSSATKIPTIDFKNHEVSFEDANNEIPREEQNLVKEQVLFEQQNNTVGFFYSKNNEKYDDYGETFDYYEDEYWFVQGVPEIDNRVEDNNINDLVNVYKNHLEDIKDSVDIFSFWKSVTKVYFTAFSDQQAQLTLLEIWKVKNVMLIDSTPSIIAMFKNYLISANINVYSENFSDITQDDIYANLSSKLLHTDTEKHVIRYQGIVKLNQKTKECFITHESHTGVEEEDESSHETGAPTIPENKKNILVLKNFLEENGYKGVLNFGFLQFGNSFKIIKENGGITLQGPFCQELLTLRSLLYKYFQNEQIK